MYLRLIMAVMFLLPLSGHTEEIAVIQEAWVRALPPTQPNTAAYMTIANPGSSPLTLTGACASVAGRVEIHTIREVDGLTRMEQLSSVVIPAGGRVALAPGETHLMLLNLERMPAVGESVTLCLDFSGADRICTEAAVRKSAVATGGHEHHHHQE